MYGPWFLIWKGDAPKKKKGKAKRKAWKLTVTTAYKEAQKRKFSGKLSCHILDVGACKRDDGDTKFSCILKPGTEIYSTDENGELVDNDARGTKIWSLDLNRCFSVEILQQGKGKKSKQPAQDFPMVVNLGVTHELPLIPNNPQRCLPDLYGE